MFRIMSVLVMLLLSASAVIAQYTMADTRISETNGLSDNRVTCFLKDRDGFMWIGTANGLNRYDGYAFTIYLPGQAEHNISHEYINAIEEDAQGRLWISTWGGLNILDKNTDSLTVLSPDREGSDNSTSRISSALIWDTHIDESGNVWFAPDARNLGYYDPVKKTFTNYPFREFIRNTFPSRHRDAYISIHKIIARSSRSLWLGTSMGLFSFDMDTKVFTYFGGDDPEDVVALYYDSLRHNVYIAQQKLYVLREGATAVEAIDAEHNTRFHSARETRRILPTQTRLTQVYLASGEAESIPVPDSYDFGIHRTHVTSVYYDPDGLVWIGTPQGISKYDSRMEVFRFAPVFPDTISTTGNVFHIHPSVIDHKLYVSSYTRDEVIVIDTLGTREVINTANGKPIDQCTQVFEDHHGDLWLLTRPAIFRLDRKTKVLTQLPVPGQRPDMHFIEMTEDADGGLWFASLHFGLYHYAVAENKWTHFSDADDYYGRRVTALLSDPTHRAVWIGDFGFGVFRYNLDTKKFKFYPPDTENPYAPQSSMVNDLVLDKNKNVWIATTTGGLCKFDYDAPADKKFKTWSIQNGLPESTIHAIQCDMQGNLWLSSFKGLTCIDINGNVIRHFDKTNGLPFTNFTTPMSINAKGELMSGIANGFIRFHPDSLNVASSDFSVVITALLVNDTMMAEGDTYSFDYDENALTFRFSALSYSLPQRVRYFYQLEGYDHDWVDADNTHLAKYTNLNDGTYTFKVKAIDHAGKQSLNEATMHITIHPPFWKRWWFGVLITAIVFTTLLLWMRTQQQKVRSQKILNQIATSLYSQHTLEDVFWSVAKHCVDFLHFEDCVIYYIDDEKDALIQKAAAGPKSEKPYQVLNPIAIPTGEGIVGTVAKTGKPEVIADTSLDRRYIVDDARRFSEIAVPIMVDNKVFGVIDSEHPKKNFYTSWHLHMMEEIAAICSAKVSRYFVEDQIRSKVARDLHDDMGSTLSSINIMSKIALEKDEPETSRNYLRTIRDNATMMQESMSDMVWAINPENDTMEKVLIRMKEFAAEILEPLNIQYIFTEVGDFNRAKMDLTTRKDFFLIFKEAINNAAKYSGCEKVTIDLRSDEKGLALIIRDNGAGFDTLHVRRGNGLHNMARRAANIRARFRVESHPGEGATIFVTRSSHD